jgi:putative DNA primase/helicase
VSETPDAAAREFLRWGWVPIPVPFREKAPVLPGWQTLRLTDADVGLYFNGGPQNIGLLLGALADVDLDCPEALAVAPDFLPRTDRIHGRPGRPRSHYFYERAEARPGLAYEDPITRTKLVELRGTGQQTIVPPSVHPSGEPLTWERAGAPARVDADDLEQAVGRVAAVALIARVWPPRGTRHDFALALGGFLLRGGLDEELTVRVVGAAALIAGADVSGRVRDIRDTARRVATGRAVTGGPRLEELLPSEPAKVLDVLRRWLRLRVPRPHLTDAGNAERFATQHHEDVRYVYAWRTWLVWDETRWQRDAGALVMRRAKMTARRLYAEAAQEPDDEERKRIVAWAKLSESEPRLRAMLLLAQSEPGMAVTPDQLDRDPFLLNCLNGTLELRTGHLRPHRRDDLLTKLTAAPYAPEASHPVWEACLTRLLPDASLRSFIQRVAGYCLTGSVAEEKLFIVHGPAAGGKSTLLGALRRTWGDYATTCDFSTFAVRRPDGGPREDLARLHGARLVVSSEVRDGTRVAEGLVKTWTGGDPVVARRLYEPSFEFIPQFKLVVAANDRPRVRDDDDAIWRRIVEVPFRESLPVAERDPSVKRTLMDPTEAGAAILAWAAAGATAWFAEGLGSAPDVDTATADYRQAMDPLRDFFAEVCVFIPTGEALASMLRSAYETWCRDTGVRFPVSTREFAARLQARGCVKRKGTDGVRVWRGVRLRTPKDPADDANGANGPNGAEFQNSSRARAYTEKVTEPGATDATDATEEKLPGWVTGAEPDP